MKVFANRLHGGYCGGIILVAANSKEEAINAFHSDPEYDYMYDNYDYETVEINESKIYDHYYQPDDWFEMPHLTANVDCPQVLIEGSYGE